MSAPTTEEEVTPATEDAGGGGSLTAEDVEVLTAAFTQSGQNQPTIKLLDPSAPVEARKMGDTFLVSVGDLDITMDPATGLYAPVDPEPIRTLLVEKLAGLHGDTLFDVGGEQRAIDWTSVQVTPDGTGVLDRDGILTANAITADGQSVLLTIDLEWNVTAAALDGAQVGVLPEGVAVTATYLQGEYGSVFAFEGQSYTIDWESWDPDQNTDEGMVGSEVKATAEGVEGAHNLYVWFIPGSGVHVVRAEPDDDSLEGVSTMFEEAEADAQDAELLTYLREYFADPHSFNDRSLTIDWDTWVVTSRDDAVVTFTATADELDYEERHQIEAEFSIESPAVKITVGPDPRAADDDLDGAAGLSDEDEATDEAGDEAEDEAGEEDLEAQFVTLTETLVAGWGDSHELEFDGKKYDVAKGELERDGYDDDYWYFKVNGAPTADGEPKNLRLKVVDAEDVAIESVS